MIFPHDNLNYVSPEDELANAIIELKEATDNLRKANLVLDEINKAQEENLGILKEITQSIRLSL